MFYTQYPVLTAVVASGLFLFNTVTTQAADNIYTLDQQLLELQQQMQIQQQNTAAQISALEKRINGSSATSTAKVNAATQNGGLQTGLSGLFSAGGSSVDNDALEGLQAGAHDPNQNGFTVQNVELSIGGTVDTYLD